MHGFRVAAMTPLPEQPEMQKMFPRLKVPTGTLEAWEPGLQRLSTVTRHSDRRVLCNSILFAEVKRLLTRGAEPSPRGRSYRSTRNARTTERAVRRTPRLSTGHAEGPWCHWHQGPEGTATPSADFGTASAFCFRGPDRNAVGGAGIAVARPETTSLSMSCGTRAQMSTRAILMAPGSSVLPSVIGHLPTAEPPVRASAADAFTGVPLTSSLRGTACGGP